MLFGGPGRRFLPGDLSLAGRHSQEGGKTLPGELEEVEQQRREPWRSLGLEKKQTKPKEKQAGSLDPHDCPHVHFFSCFFFTYLCSPNPHFAFIQLHQVCPTAPENQLLKDYAAFIFVTRA